MNHSLKIAAAAAVVAAVSGTAHAADISRGAGVYTPPPAPVATSTAYNWSGFYAGALAAYGWGNVNGDYDGNGDGFLAGGFVGYNMQVAGPWVLGIEGDLLWSGIDGSAGGYGFDTNWTSTLRGRVGYAFDRFLVYGTGGLAVGDVNFAGYSNTRTGYAVGGGVEAALANNLVGRVEYLYTNLGSDSYGGASETFDSSQIRVGVGFKF